MVRTKKIYPGVTLFTNDDINGLYEDMCLYLEKFDILLVLNKGDLDYVIEGVSLEEAEDFIDICSNEPSEEVYNAYGLDDESTLSEFEDYFGSLETFVNGAKWLGVIPKSARVSCDPTCDKLLKKFLECLFETIGR